MSFDHQARRATAPGCIDCIRARLAALTLDGLALLPLALTGVVLLAALADELGLAAYIG